MRKPTPKTSAHIYADSNLYIKELKGYLRISATLTKGDLLGLDHTNMACKGNPMHITTPTKPQLYRLGDPLLILPGLHSLLGPMHLSIVPSKPASCFNLMLYHNLSRIHHSRGGAPNTIMLQLYCLDDLPNHSSYTLVLPSNPRFLPSQI